MPSSVPLLALPWRQFLFIVRCMTARKMTNLVLRRWPRDPISGGHVQPVATRTVLLLSGAHRPRPTILSASGPSRDTPMLSRYRFARAHALWGHLHPSSTQCTGVRTTTCLFHAANPVPCSSWMRP